MIQTILGAGGAIGNPLARELKKYNCDIRLVSRNPKQVNGTDKLMSIDVFNLEEIEKSIQGSEVVYVTIGFEYRLKVWKQIWPSFMRAVLDGCQKHNAKLVFFDNMYLYDRNAVPSMTEESPINPPSEKGKIRRQLHEMIFEAVDKGKVQALVARSADFYGPENRASILNLMVADNLLKGKKAQVFGNPDKVHTFTYTPDAAAATAILGNTPDAYNQVWHVPTTKERITMRGWIEMIARELDREPKIQPAPSWMIHLLGIFIPVMREFPEMLYQYEQDYVFDSSKFEKRFGMKAISPADGVRNTFSNYGK